MGLSVTLRNSVYERVAVVYDPREVVFALRERARAAGILEELVHLRAIDAFGEAAFNWFQVDGLMREMRRAVAAGDTPIDADEFLEDLAGLCEDVTHFRWYLHFVGD